jgi:hypothetical protein
LAQELEQKDKSLENLSILLEQKCTDLSQVESELNSFRDNFDFLQNSNANLARELEKERHIIVGLTQGKDALSKKCDELTTEVKVQQSSAESLKKSIRSLNDELEFKVISVDRLRKEKDILEKKCKEIPGLESELESLRIEVESLARSNHSLAQDLEHKEETILSLCQKKILLEQKCTDLSQVESEIGDLRKDVDLLQNANANQARELEKERRNLVGLTQEKDILSEKCDELTTKVELQQVSAETLQNSIDTLNQELEFKMISLDRLSKEKDILEKKCKEIPNLESELELLRLDRSSLQSSKQSLTEELQQMKNSLSNLTKERNNLELKCSELEDLRNNSQARMSQQISVIQSKDSEIDSLRNDMDSLQNAKKSLSRELEKERRNIVGLTQEKNVLSKKCDELITEVKFQQVSAEKSINALNQELEFKMISLDRLCKENGVLEKRCEVIPQLQSELDSLRLDFSSVQISNKSLDQELQQKEKILLDISQEKNRLELKCSELEDLRNNSLAKMSQQVSVIQSKEMENDSLKLENETLQKAVADLSKLKDQEIKTLIASYDADHKAKIQAVISYARKMEAKSVSSDTGLSKRNMDKLESDRKRAILEVWCQHMAYQKFIQKERIQLLETKLKLAQLPAESIANPSSKIRLESQEWLNPVLARVQADKDRLNSVEIFLKAALGSSELPDRLLVYLKNSLSLLAISLEGIKKGVDEETVEIEWTGMDFDDLFELIRQDERKNSLVVSRDSLETVTRTRDKLHRENQDLWRIVQKRVKKDKPPAKASRNVQTEQRFLATTASQTHSVDVYSQFVQAQADIGINNFLCAFDLSKTKYFL